MWGFCFGLMGLDRDGGNRDAWIGVRFCCLLLVLLVREQRWREGFVLCRIHRGFHISVVVLDLGMIITLGRRVDLFPATTPPSSEVVD